MLLFDLLHNLFKDKICDSCKRLCLDKISIHTISSAYKSLTDFGGALLPLECCELNAMKYILQNDGNHVLQVIGEGTEKGLSFDGISVFYGKEK